MMVRDIEPGPVVIWPDVNVYADVGVWTDRE